jgi:RHS repeat-associated protein
VSQHRSGATTFENVDYLGTSTRQTNASQSTTATRSYDAFGNLVATTGTPIGPFGFAGDKGYQEDPDSGLKLLGHRYYDPSTGRFLTRDPAKDGRNWYVYCDGGPTRRTDPSGLLPPWLEKVGGVLGHPFFRMATCALGLLGGIFLVAKHAHGQHRGGVKDPPQLPVGTYGAGGWNPPIQQPQVPTMGGGRGWRNASGQQWWLDPDK